MAWRKPLTGWTSRLPTATFGGYREQGRHSKPILAWQAWRLQEAFREIAHLAYGHYTEFPETWTDEVR